MHARCCLEKWCIDLLCNLAETLLPVVYSKWTDFTFKSKAYQRHQITRCQPAVTTNCAGTNYFQDIFRAECRLYFLAIPGFVSIRRFDKLPMRATHTRMINTSKLKVCEYIYPLQNVRTLCNVHTLHARQPRALLLYCRLINWAPEDCNVLGKRQNFFASVYERFCQKRSHNVLNKLTCGPVIYCHVSLVVPPRPEPHGDRTGFTEIDTGLMISSLAPTAYTGCHFGKLQYVCGHILLYRNAHA